MLKKRGKNLLASLLSVLIGFVLVGWVQQGHSQEKYPIRAIEIIVPFSPGGVTDLTCRIMASSLSKKWGVPVNVVNKPGGNTIPACLEVYNAPPNGYTMLSDSLPSASMLPIAVKSLPFKVMDRTFVGMNSAAHFVVIVPSTSPFKTMKELEAEARKNPENFTWGSIGGVGGADYAARQLIKAFGVDILRTKPVMTQGGSQAASLTAGGHVMMSTPSTSSALPAISGKTVRALGITATHRWPDLPDVPTMEELGYPIVNSVNWVGISGPPKLPSHIVDIWDKATQEIVKDPNIVSKFQNVGAIVFYRNPSATIDFVMKEMDEVNKLWGVK